VAGGFRVWLPVGSVKYQPMAIERSRFERTMGIFNALTSILIAYYANLTG
jgi:hypothetical protein